MKTNFLFRTIWLIVLVISLSGCCQLRNPERRAEMEAWMEARITEGTYGFQLSEVSPDREVVCRNVGTVFYPASTIKVLELVHAMQAVEAGDARLGSRLSKFANESESCADNHSGHTATSLSLETALSEMMRQSDNQSTNAVQEFFGNGHAATGREAMNTTAREVLGMRNTALNHKFGCGGPAKFDPANTMTLQDISKLYKNLAQGLLNSTTTAKLDEIIQDASMAPVIDEEAGDLGLSSSVVSDYKARMRSRKKAGNLLSGGKRYQSIAGWVSLPRRTGDPRQFVFAVYVDRCNKDDDQFMTEAARELLRREIRSTLATFR